MNRPDRGKKYLRVTFQHIALHLEAILLRQRPSAHEEKASVAIWQAHSLLVQRSCSLSNKCARHKEFREAEYLIQSSLLASRWRQRLPLFDHLGSKKVLRNNKEIENLKRKQIVI